MNELERKYLETLERLNVVNKILKTCGGKFKGKKYLVREKKQLLKLKDILEFEIATNPKTFFVDKWGFTVRSYTKRTKGKPRYLVYNGKTQNHMNGCLLHNPIYQLTYAWLDTNSQLTRKDIQKAIKVAKEIFDDAIVVTDKRHIHTLTFRKRYTQTIERMISRIKIPIYPELAKAKSPKEVYDIYFKRMRELGINIIP
jgi:hypothetical protein